MLWGEDLGAVWRLAEERRGRRRLREKEEKGGEGRAKEGAREWKEDEDDGEVKEEKKEVESEVRTEESEKGGAAWHSSGRNQRERVRPPSSSIGG